MKLIVFDTRRPGPLREALAKTSAKSPRTLKITHHSLPSVLSVGGYFTFFGASFVPWKACSPMLLIWLPALKLSAESLSQLQKANYSMTRTLLGMKSFLNPQQQKHELQMRSRRVPGSKTSSRNSMQPLNALTPSSLTLLETITLLTALSSNHSLPTTSRPSGSRRTFLVLCPIPSCSRVFPTCGGTSICWTAVVRKQSQPSSWMPWFSRKSLSRRQPLKARSPIFRSLGGAAKDYSPHWKKALVPISSSSDLSPKTTCSRLLHSVNALSPITRRACGSVMVFSPLDWNIRGERRSSLPPC